MLEVRPYHQGRSLPLAIRRYLPAVSCGVFVGVQSDSRSIAKRDSPGSHPYPDGSQEVCRLDTKLDASALTVSKMFGSSRDCSPNAPADE